MSIEEIMIEIIKTTAVETIIQLARLVEAHSEYRGKLKGKGLENKVKKIYHSERFQQELKSDSYIELKIGRFKGTLDLS